MREIKRGPIIGMVDQTKAKIWFYGSFADGGQTKPYCHVKDKEKTSPIPGSPFEFKEVSSFPYQKDGTLHKAYVAEIIFPGEGEEFCFGIHYARDTEPEDFNYQVKRFPKEGDVDFSFGLISCHKPREGKLKRITDMWGFLYEKMAEKESRFLIQSGDQVYCDSDDPYTINAWQKSLALLGDGLDTRAQQHRDMVDFYREVYFSGWEFSPVREVMSTFPQFMIWDDHEIEDGWGSKPEHFEETQQRIFAAAKEAYIEFQHSHNPEPLKAGTLYYAFHYGSAAFLVLDLRGERNLVKKRLLSDEQWDEIGKWLNADNSKILFVVASVPVVHVSRRLMSMAKVASLLSKDAKDDVDDQWSADHNKGERGKLLELLFKWSEAGGKKRPVAILGGDVHVGTEVIMNKKGSDNRICQVTSSPITNNRALVLDFFSAPFSSRFSFRLKEKGKEKINAEVKRRHRKRNFAILEVTYESGKPKVKLNMFRQGEKKPKTWEFPI